MFSLPAFFSRAEKFLLNRFLIVSLAIHPKERCQTSFFPRTFYPVMSQQYSTASSTGYLENTIKCSLGCFLHCDLNFFSPTLPFSLSWWNFHFIHTLNLSSPITLCSLQIHHEHSTLITQFFLTDTSSIFHCLLKSYLSKNSTFSEDFQINLAHRIIPLSLFLKAQISLYFPQ